MTEPTIFDHEYRHSCRDNGDDKRCKCTVCGKRYREHEDRMPAPFVSEDGHYVEDAEWRELLRRNRP